ncbi:MAG: Ig-like domain-containing protein, partial [Pseudomonadota bacterium]
VDIGLLFRPNDPPDAIRNEYAVTEGDDAAVIGNVVAYDTGDGADSDPNGDTLTVTAVAGLVAIAGGAFAGTVTSQDGREAFVQIGPDGQIEFDDNDNFTELAAGETDTITLTYTIDDGEGGSDSAEIVITVNGVNEPPEATDNAALTDEETPVSGNVIFDDDGFGVDGDPNGDDLTVTAVSFGPVGVPTPVATDSGDYSGQLTVDPDGSYSFTPDAGLGELTVGETETVTFTYTISDGNGGTDTAEVVITIEGLNEPPVAVDDAITIEEGQSVGVAADDPALNILTNDSDPDGDAITVAEVEGQTMPAGGSVTVTVFSSALNAEVDVTIAEDGTLTYADDGAFDALDDGESDSFTLTYEASDGDASSNPATVTVTIEGKNDAPPPVASEYNILFLVDGSDSTQTTTGAHALTSTDINGDGVAGSIFDAELEAVQQMVDAFGQMNLGTDVEIGIFTFESALSVINPNEPNTQITQLLPGGGEKSIFAPGDDLTGAFAGAHGDGVAVFNSAIAGANDFFAAQDDPATADTVNLVYILSDSFGFDWTLGGDPGLAAELTELTTLHGGVVDNLIFSTPIVPSPFVQQIELLAGDGQTNQINNQSDMTQYTDNLILSGNLV